MTSPAPTTAERIRSTCVRASCAILAVERVEPTSTSVHHLLDDGSFAITVPGDGMLAGIALAAGTAGVQAVLEMTDVAPLPLREPVRALVWVRGRLHCVPVSEIATLLDVIAAEDPNTALLQVNSDFVADTSFALLRLEVESVVVADSTGAESVAVGALLGARADPFCAVDVLAATPGVGASRGRRPAGRAAADGAAPRPVRPLSLDRYGVQLRVESEDGDHDVRLPFAKPVDDITGLSQAIRILMGCPFLNGIRTRRL